MNKHLRNILIILVVSVFITFTFDFIYGGESFQLISILLNVLYGVIIGSSISLSGIISHFIIAKYDITNNPIKTYVILLVAVFLFISIDVIAVNILWYRYLLKIPFDRIFASTSIIVISIATIFVGLTIFFIILSKSFMTQFLRSEKEKHVAIKEADNAKFETLKSQINPHFLFNSLNTLSTLILIDSKKAEMFTSQLSNIYRYILDNQDEELVAVSREIEFAKDYIELQTIRFSSNFSIDFQDYKGENYPLIIPLSLQLLLENVFKHNIISQKRKVHISIYYEENHIVIKNNKNIGKELKPSHSVGLSNILNRYELLCDESVVIEDTANYFTVKLPLIFSD